MPAGLAKAMLHRCLELATLQLKQFAKDRLHQVHAWRYLEPAACQGAVLNFDLWLYQSKELGYKPVLSTEDL